MLTRIIMIIILFALHIKSVSYGIYEIKRKNPYGGAAVFVLSAVSVVSGITMVLKF